MAEEFKLDITHFELVDAPHSHAAAEEAVRLAREAKAEMLMKGSLHTDELIGAVVRSASGLRTERRISHVFILDVPSLDRPLFITDAAINIMPTLEDKQQITQNAIDLAHALGLSQPKVAILSAMETVNPKVTSTVEAAALCKMADRKQITGGILDGPLALDNAINLGAAQIKGIDSPVAGLADILVVPDLEAGNMLAKSLTFLADADAAGIVLGARVPIILTSRSDSVTTRLASCAVAASLPTPGGNRRRRCWCNERRDSSSQCRLVEHQVLYILSGGPSSLLFAGRAIRRTLYPAPFYRPGRRRRCPWRKTMGTWRYVKSCTGRDLPVRFSTPTTRRASTCRRRSSRGTWRYRLCGAGPRHSRNR